STTENILKLIETASPQSWGNKARELAVDAFSKQGIPNRKSEEYKYVNMEQALKSALSLSSFIKLSKKQISDVQFLKSAIVIVIENGVYSSEHSQTDSLPKGIIIKNISEAVAEEIFQNHYAKYADVNSDPFIALNTALASGGVFIHVVKNAVIETPIHLIQISSASENTLVNARNLIVVEENAHVKIVESNFVVDSERTFNNSLTEIVVAANANVEYDKIQDEQNNGYSVNTLQAIQKKQSVFSINTFTLSGSLVRNNWNIVLDDEHIETHLNGLYLTKDNQVVDNHTLVDHRKPNCNSNELYKGIIEDKSSATFNGKIYVRKDAQKTNAFQSNKNILLSDDGTINTKPQLEIYADDVKCSHGTSTGKLDEDKIFYLRARGLSEASAKKLLMHAFASEVVDCIKIVELRDYIEKEITKRFE
ncbi:MAG: Fe-S cluster assembly protein SufD, partial [Bacteroidetes bacterium]|nr:Fe-S cluster assembly protein SufD [Bacteroidota bacterium]